MLKYVVLYQALDMLYENARKTSIIHLLCHTFYSKVFFFLSLCIFFFQWKWDTYIVIFPVSEYKYRQIRTDTHRDTETNKCIHKHRHLYIYVYMYIYVSAYICVYICIYLIFINTHVCINIYVLTCTYLNMSVCMYVRRYVCMYVDPVLAFRHISIRIHKCLQTGRQAQRHTDTQI